jgi:peptide/nickel transport system substrate-binding protein
MFMIMTYDQGKEDSAIFDAAAKANLDTFMSHYKGTRIVSTDPLTIESYDDTFFVDAESMVRTWWPAYTYGPGAWHNIALGVFAEAQKKLAFSADKADVLQVEWMSYVAGPSLEILKGELDTVEVSGTIPYTPTMSQYVKPEEAVARYGNLHKFYSLQGHFWIGTGPLQVNKAFPVEATLTLDRNPNYPDAADKWLRFGTPAIPVVELDGPGQVKIGDAASYDVFVTFQGKPYASTDLAGVKYLVFDATGASVAIGEATLAEEGHYTIALGADVTGKLTAGSNKLEVVVTSKTESLPAFATLEFVTQ